METILIPMLLIITAHFFVDFYMNLLPGLMPSIAANLSLSMTLSGLLFTLQSMASSWLQPIFGYIGGRYSVPKVLAVSLIFTALLMSTVGTATNYILLLLIIFLGSISSAIFHPFGSVAISTVTQKNQGFIMSLYFAAGTLGMTIVPILSTMTKNRLGLNGILLWGIPGILTGIVILSLKNRVPNVTSYKIVKSEDKSANLVKTIFVLVIIVGLRSWVSNTFTMYIPIYYVTRGFTEEAAGGIQSAFLLLTGIGGILGGIITDRIGVKKTLIISGFLATVTLLGFFFVNGIPAIIFLLLSGALLQSAYPGVVVLAQRVNPESQSINTGFLQGFGYGIGGLGSVVTGALADIFSGNLHFALFNNVVILLASLMVCIFFFPDLGKDNKDSYTIGYS
jgi:FSR family fosmidomycin resistance protein-like MFS transporter